jgi:hypothetical protein
MKFISVARAADRWIVSVENEVPQTFASRGEAIVAAFVLGRRVHRESGLPCAVRALLSNGEWSVLSRFDTVTS